jgi:hypothetical protein
MNYMKIIFFIGFCFSIFGQGSQEDLKNVKTFVIDPNDVVVDYELKFYNSGYDSDERIPYMYAGHPYINGSFMLVTDVDSDKIVGMVIPDKDFYNIVSFLLASEDGNILSTNIMDVDSKPHNVNKKPYMHKINVYHYKIDASKLPPGRYSFDIKVDEKRFPNKKIRYRYAKYFGGETGQNVHNEVVTFMVKEAKTTKEKEEAAFDLLRYKEDAGDDIYEDMLKLLGRVKDIKNRRSIGGAIVYLLIDRKSLDAISWFLCDSRYYKGDYNLAALNAIIENYYGGWENVLKHKSEIMQKTKEIDEKYYVANEKPIYDWNDVDISKYYELKKESDRLSATINDKKIELQNHKK